MLNQLPQKNTINEKLIIKKKRKRLRSEMRDKIK
jgi:hypothetical protein